MNFSGNSSSLMFLFFTIFNFSCHLTFVFILPSNSATTSFVFFKSFSLSQLSHSAINSLYYTKYFTIPLIFLLFNIFSTFHSSIPSTSTSFTFSIFCLSTCSLYYTIWLTFTTRWIFIKVGSCNLTTLVDTTLSIIYEPTY